MADYGIGNERSVNGFVRAKLDAFGAMERDFRSLFTLMFREEDNVMYERSEGYRIRSTTYGEAKTHVLEKAAALKAVLGHLEEDAVVGLHMDNSLEWIETFWAILAAGFRPLLMNLRLPDELLHEAMDACRCRAVISGTKTFPGLTIAPSRLGSGESIPLPDRFGSELLVMSSGTSRHVKVCAYTGEEFYYQIRDSYDIIRRCRAIKRHCGYRLKLLTFLPFYHVFGLIAVYIWFAFFSRTFVHLPDMSPQTILSTIRRHRVTHIFAVPLFWETVQAQAMKTIRGRGEATLRRFERAVALWKKLPGPLGALFSRIAFREVRDNLFGESIRFMISGGSAIPNDTLAFFNAIGYRLVNGYGMTEVGITSVELSTRKKYLLSGYVGGPMSNAEYAVNDDGELLVRGRVMAKYVISDGARTDRDGWFNTHDLARCDGGHYQILGRRDDLIVSPGGENLNPNLLEPMLRAEGAEAVCLIGARQDGETAPVLLVAVHPFTPRQKLEKLADREKALIAAAGLSGEIRRVAFVAGPLLQGDEFKLNRLRLARDYEAGRLSILDPSERREEEPADELLRQVIVFFAAALDKDVSSIAADADFFLDEGGTSLDYFAMISRMQDSFGIDFPADGETGLHTPRQFADYIRKDLAR